MKKILILSLIVLWGGARISAQIDVAKLLEAGIADANVLAQPYLKPYGEMLGSSLNSGWYTSAKPHKLLGFDITFTGTYTMTPSSATSFNIGEMKLQTFELADQNNAIAPTVAGDAGNRRDQTPLALSRGAQHGA